MLVHPAQRILPVAIILACALPSTFAVQGPVAWPPGVDVRIQAQPQSATVGDPIRFDLDITVPPGWSVIVPKPPNEAGPFEVLEFLPGPALPASVGQSPAAPPSTAVRHRARVVAAAYKTGDFEFPPMRILLRTAEGKDLEIAGPPLKVRIESVLTEKDRGLKTLKKQAEIQEPARWVLWLVLAAAGLCVAAVAWWMWNRRRRPGLPSPFTSRVDTLELAEAELRDLIGRGLLEKGLVKPFYVALSEIVKKAIESGYRVPTLERTTSEIMDDLRADPRSPDAAGVIRIESLLLGCDLVKFAKHVPDAPESQAAIQSAFQIVRDCKAWKASLDAASAPVMEST